MHSLKKKGNKDIFSSTFCKTFSTYGRRNVSTKLLTCPQNRQLSVTDLHASISCYRSIFLRKGEFSCSWP